MVANQIHPQCTKPRRGDILIEKFIGGSFYLFPFTRLCVLHNIWQFFISVTPPLLQAETWSASISFSFQILFLLASGPIAQSGQFEISFFAAACVCFAYTDFFVASSNTRTSSKWGQSYRQEYIQILLCDF